ncbi:hypothetical protein BCR36DRAFT_187558 [Piromyces finnis]|uniref:Uncharacterized protein n=1 Tax=Piromyces finnis TaxID=1754191 RepID=A0A1Y1VGE3_9FUNG|nr:hypothetical protein BCR36DRAFT_187558 [Piromyces finnis]|eukprot:ORX55496.1 hypothetical protein BCR36DRAFT_187558 [Piromyces finnis]
MLIIYIRFLLLSSFFFLKLETFFLFIKLVYNADKEYYYFTFFFFIKNIFLYIVILTINL